MSAVAPVTLNDTDGSRIYRRSLTLVLVTAAAELSRMRRSSSSTPRRRWARTTAACAVASRSAPASWTPSPRGCAPSSHADVPIHKTKVPLAQAVAIFEARGETDKARLLTHRQQDSLVLYELCGRRDYFQGYMLPSTGGLRQFALHPLGGGLRPAVPAHGHAGRTGALRDLSEAVSGLRAGRRLARHAGHPRHRRAQRRDRAGATARSVPGR